LQAVSDFTGAIRKSCPQANPEKPRRKKQADTDIAALERCDKLTKKQSLCGNGEKAITEY
jgi:hypothetical protein